MSLRLSRMEISRLGDLTARHELDSKARTFIEFARSLAVARGFGDAIRDLEMRLGPRSPHVERLKSVIGPETTGSALSNVRTLGNSFLELTRPRRLIGQLQGLGARPAPLNVRIPIVSTGTVAGWFEQGTAMPATSLAVELGVLPPTTIGTILGVVRELMKSALPQASRLLETTSGAPWSNSRTARCSTLRPAWR